MKFLKTTSHCPGFSEALVPLLRVLLAVSVLFFAASQVCLVLAQTDEEPNPSDQLVHIPDLQLRRALEKALGKTAGADITQADMKTLREFWCGHSGVRDLTGLEYATNLVYLEAGSGAIVDLSPLKNLTKLERIVLTVNRITDISPLQGLRQLRAVFLGYNRITDISPLQELTMLETLRLDYNRIVDISPLSKLIWLTNLYIKDNQIADISPLSELYLGYGTVDLRNNRIVDVSPLEHLTDLRRLFLSGNPVSDFSPLSELHLTNYDFEPVLEVPDSIDIPDPVLRRAIASRLRKNINDPITQADMENVRHLYPPRTEVVRDLTGLEYAKNLVFLELVGSKIGDLSPLSQLTNLQELALWTCGIIDISPLAKLKQLTRLRLGDNAIVDVSPLAGLEQLTILSVYRNQIIDISPLASLQRLTSLDIRGNPIVDLSPLEGLKNLVDLEKDQYPPLDHSVRIPDAGLRAAIEGALGKEAGDTIMKSELEALTSLDASNRDIDDLEGLQYAVNLTAVNLTDNRIGHLYELRSKKITRLELAGNLFAGGMILSTAYPELTYLDLSRNLISDIYSYDINLEKITNLETLNLAENDIEDVQGLSSLLTSLTSLRTLNLADNKVADVSPLASLTQLKKLYLRDNPATDFSALYELIPNLDDADFSYQPVETEQPNPQTPGDETLQGIAIPDAALREALEAALGKASGETITQADMETLRRFNVNRAGIQDLTGLEYAINLRRLDLARNQISDVSALSGLTQLRRLDLRRNRISDFSPIAGLTDNLARYRKGNQKTGRPKNTPINVDVNRNGVVDATDLDIVSRYEGRQLSSVESGLYPDVNGDGKIDTKDVLAVTERLPSGSVSGTGQ